MKINVITVTSGWILQKIAERIVENAPEGVEMTLTHSPRRNENNFYVDVTNCYRGKLGGKDIGLFTHIDENKMSNIPDLWFNIDGLIHMSLASCVKFTHDPRFLKYNPLMVAKMPGEIPSGFSYIKPTIGIFQRGKYEGKGFNLMLELAEDPVANEFKWLFAGNDWEEVSDKLDDVLQKTDHELAWPGEYQALYNVCDYVLIPSKWEGGPMSLIEAAALGKRIIAPSVGWAGVEIPIDY
jgi:hypothetical protein